MDLFKRAQKLVSEMPSMTTRKMVDDSCSLIADLLEEVERITDERDELKSDIVRYKMHLENAERAAKANGKLADDLQSSLTLSREEGRREGMMRAAEISDETPTPGFASDLKQDGYEQATNDIAAAIRSEAKGGNSSRLIRVLPFGPLYGALP